jgi:hypothetical protein
LISGVTCDAPYEWLDKTDSEWEFKRDQSSETFHVSIDTISYMSNMNIVHDIHFISFVGGCL